MAVKIRQNSVLSLIKARRTTFEYADKAVSQKDVDQLLEAGRWSPSSLNVQPWRFVVVRNHKLVKQLIETCSYGYFYAQPALLIAFVLPHEKLGGNHRGAKMGRIGEIDAYLCFSMPAYGMCLEAESLGLGTSLLTPHSEKAQRLLKLKSGDSCPLMLGIGYPKSGGFRNEHVREQLDKIVQYED